LIALGNVSRIKGNDYKDKLITTHNPFSPISEAYRIMRTNLQFMTVDQSVKSIMVTSPNPGEGKSITAANLAVIMAQADLKTILVDADLRRPSMHKIFQVSNLEGLTNLLRSSEYDLNHYLKHTGIENLQVVTSGPLPPNPSELLSSQRMARLLERLEEEMADIIIFDSPPVLAVTDATVLSGRVGGVILVTQAKRTRRDAVKQTINRLEHVGARILGGILNNVSGKGDYSHYSYYTRSGHILAGQGQSAWQRLWQLLPVLRSSR
jgi:capsular exopolysaccharide synthesis family protein